MKTVKIFRDESTNQGTFGRLTMEGFHCFTGELPWLNNESKISCIPAGKYIAQWAKSPRLHKLTYRLTNVPHRDGVLIHSANLMGNKAAGYKAQLEGCIALGERRGYLEGQKAILISQPTVKAFERLLDGQPFILEINS
jgi:hypothetical protein